MNKLPKESGQALLLVLLSMAVVLTIVLSIVSRTVTDITVSTKGDESLRAFSAAEAGIEQALITGASIAQTSIGNASYAANVTGLTSTSQEFSNPIAISSGESLVLWLVGHDSNGSLTCSGTTCFTGDKIKLCWGNAGTSANSSTTPAVEVSVFYSGTPGNYSTLQIARGVYDPNSARRATNSFSPDDGSACTVGGDSFAFSKLISLGAGGLGIPSSVYTVQNGIQFIKVRAFYNTDVSHKIGLSTLGLSSPGNNLLFPPQGATIESTGTAGASNRKIQVFQGYGDPPEVFDAAIYSPSGLVK